MNNHYRYLYQLLVLTFLSLVIPHNALAQEETLESPHFRVLTEGITADKLPLLLTSVDIDIVGFVADVKVTQYYKNDGNVPLEAIYLFPGSTGGAVYAMSMQVGERTIKGVVQRREQARETYERAVAEGKTSSLLEQNEFNYFQTRVGNILPGDDIQVELRYTETLIPDQGLYSFRFPTIRQAAGNKARRNNQVNASVNVTRDIGFDVTARVQAGMPIAHIDSPSHPMDIQQLNNGAELTLRDEGFFSGDRDFILNYRLSGDRIQSGLLLYQGKDENYFLLMAQPPAKVDNTHIPPREYLFVVDVSGSMSGYPLEIAKEIASELLIQLRPQDRFNVYLFSAGSRQYADESVTATTANVDQALALLNTQSAGGGTRLLPVLQKISSQPKTPGLSRSVIVVTDGGISVGYDTLRFIRTNLDDMNLFVFGSGKHLNQPIIEGLAKAGRGQAFLISEHDELNNKLAFDFLDYVAQPVLSDIELTYPPEFEVYDVQPSTIPDVFSQRPVYVIGKWRGRPAGNIQLTGFSGASQYTAGFPIHAANAGEHNQVLQLLWAREQLSTWQDDENIGYQGRTEEITRLGLKYNLLTPYTSFVAVDEVIRRIEGEPILRQAVQQERERPQAVTSPAPTSGWGFAPGLIAATLNPAAFSKTPSLTSVVQRQQLPLPADPERAEVTFILGEDSDDQNPYYSTATAYFSKRSKHPVVTHLRTLADVKHWLQDNPPTTGHWGIINLVTHATPWTGLSVETFSDDKATTATPLDLGTALQNSPPLPNALLDRHSQIRLYGCGLGATPRLLKQIAHYFGGDDPQHPLVAAPRTPVIFQINESTGDYQAQNWPHWWIASNRHSAMDHAELVEALRQRYGTNDWQALLQRPAPGGVPRTLTQPINISVALPNGHQLAGRIKASQLVYKQEALLSWLREVDIQPGNLRWSLQQQNGQWQLTGQGWIQQVMASPQEMPNQDAVYTVVQ